ncbi:MAG: response regulator [Deltaproteobacteria bacterium]|nr:response regulator [Deltaproteobacteria bacterium]
MSRVLVIDDNDTFKMAIGRLLQRQGFAVETLSSPIGAQARLLERDNPIDVLLLDCVMPALPGPALLAMLAKNERTAAIPVVLTSGLDNPAFAAAARTHPNARFVSKVDPVAIVNAVRALASTGTPR